MTTLMSQVKELTEQAFPHIVKCRRHLHEYPELSYQEHNTAKYIENYLGDQGIEVDGRLAVNGMTALITGKQPGTKVVALRADIDALPIQEQNEVSYKSKHAGVMHACGHDVHTSSLLGAAMILNQMTEYFSGQIKLIFQPAEERLPGGASIMIKEGVLKNPKPASIFGQHVHPPLQVGKVGVKSGIYMASADEIFLTVRGRGGHAALPQDCIDPVVLASNIILTLQQMVSRKANPTIPTVLSFGKINSIGGATNVIPSEVKLEGTFRTMNEIWRGEAHELMVTIATNLAQAGGGSCEFIIKKGYPFLCNDEELTDKFKSYAVEYLGTDNVVDLPVRMTAEDFAYYSHEIPACFYRLGTGNIAKRITSPIHTATFNVDEDCLKIGAGLMAWTALQELEK
ncbi:MAG: M20 family metallopeptidase [Saprospiraceae bacterium]|nr:M20 family metallopeptidase [Saprospiraceae bacterium]